VKKGEKPTLDKLHMETLRQIRDIEDYFRVSQRDREHLEKLLNGIDVRGNKTQIQKQ